MYVDPERVRALAEDIAARGLLHPLIVRPEGGGYGVVCGRMRLEAIRLLQREKPEAYQRLFARGIPCVVKELGDREALELSLAENIRQNTLTPEEVGRGLARLYEMGLSEEEISARVQVELEEVRRMIRLYARLREVAEQVAPSRPGRPARQARRGVSRSGLAAVAAAVERAVRLGALPRSMVDEVVRAAAELAERYSLSTSELQLLARRLSERPELAASREGLERAARELAELDLVECVVALRRDLLERARSYARQRGATLDEAINELLEQALARVEP